MVDLILQELAELIRVRRSTPGCRHTPAMIQLTDELEKRIMYASQGKPRLEVDPNEWPLPGKTKVEIHDDPIGRPNSRPRIDRLLADIGDPNVAHGRDLTHRFARFLGYQSARLAGRNELIWRTGPGCNWFEDTPNFFYNLADITFLLPSEAGITLAREQGTDGYAWIATLTLGEYSVTSPVIALPAAALAWCLISAIKDGVVPDLIVGKATWS